MDRTAAFYSHPSYQLTGSGFPIFAGSRRQRGGSLLGSIKSMVLPALKSTGKALGSNALREAVGLAKDVAGDVFAGRNIKQSLMQRGKKRALNVVKKSALQGLKQFGVARSASRKRPAKVKRGKPAKRRRVGKRLF